jgi:hypothetical protein
MILGGGDHVSNIETVPGKPRLLLVADRAAPQLHGLCSACGFVFVQRQPSATKLSESPPDVVIIDFNAAGATFVLNDAYGLKPRPVLVGLEPSRGPLTESRLDAVFTQPVHAEGLLARVIVLLNERPSQLSPPRLAPPVARGTPGGPPKATGNSLFEQVLQELRSAVPHAQASTIFQRVLVGLGSGPTQVRDVDIQNAIVSGRLLNAFEGFGRRADIVAALERVQSLVSEAPPARRR